MDTGAWEGKQTSKNDRHCEWCILLVPFSALATTSPYMVELFSEVRALETWHADIVQFVFVARACILWW